MTNEPTTYFLENATISLRSDGSISKISSPAIELDGTPSPLIGKDSQDADMSDRDISMIPIPEIISLIGTLAPGVIQLFSGIGHNYKKKVEAISEIDKGEYTDKEYRLLVHNVLSL